MSKEEVALLSHEHTPMRSWNVAATTESSVAQDKIDEMLAFYLAAFRIEENSDDTDQG